jgi:predicted transcriptional regulator
MELHLNLSPQQMANLQAVAEKEGVSIHEAALVGIDAYATNREQRLAEAIARTMKENDELLSRLSD